MRDHGHLVLVVGDDFRELGLHEFGSRRLVAETLEDVCGFFELAFHDEVAGGFGQPQKTTSEDECP